MKRELELYLHIPFCVRKCNYCDFCSASGTQEEQNAYVQAMCQEIQRYKEFAKSYEVKTVFLGGGTPSLLTGLQMEQLFQTLHDIFTIHPDAEITAEMNPGTVDLEKLTAYRHAGINRVSIGLQSTENRELHMLGRIHTYEQFLDTWKLVEKAGFKNRNIDLMSALPGQSIKNWENTLKKTLALKPEHISAYSLILEEGTKFYDWYEQGRFDEGEWKLPSEDEEYAMGELTIQMLTAHGMRRYEVSNYACPGKECRHNLGYWNREEYLGIGASSASLITLENPSIKTRSSIESDILSNPSQIRYNHVRNRRNYIELIRQGKPIEIDSEILMAEAQMEEFMFLGLRKTDGISKEHFHKTFEKTIEEIYGPVIQKLEKENLVDCKRDKITLTSRGMDISNYVLSEFLLT